MYLYKNEVIRKGNLVLHCNIKLYYKCTAFP